MRAEDYLQASEVTEKKFTGGLQLTSLQAELLHACMGVNTEAGELMDAMKRHLIYGKLIDPVNFVEECGDLLWYIAIILRLTGQTFESVMTMNIEKLKARYGDKFDSVAALVRDLSKERVALDIHFIK